MGKIIGRTLFVEHEPPANCELCGCFAELRPYGPNGKNICFACGMKDEETTKKMFKEKVLDKVDVVVDAQEIGSSN